MKSNNAGMIFDIEHGSFVDGPGIRTTVFFKGCNLKCKWCHNPESQHAYREKLFFADKCKACGLCKRVCKNEKCILCGACEKVCPAGAINICGRETSTADVMKEILADQEFYGVDGGATFSGGECMLQIDFLAELLMQCKENQIHTAVDTAGNVAWEHFEKIMPYTDLFLYDIKCASEEVHKKYTGVSNNLILDNLRRLSESFHGDILIRIPVIGGVNDSDAQMEELAEILRTVNYKAVELLPYHKMGAHKYRALGGTPESFTTPDAETIQRFQKYFGN